MIEERVRPGGTCENYGLAMRKANARHKVITHLRSLLETGSAPPKLEWRGLCVGPDAGGQGGRLRVEHPFKRAIVRLYH